MCTCTHTQLLMLLIIVNGFLLYSFIGVFKRDRIASQMERERLLIIDDHLVYCTAVYEATVVKIPARQVTID